MGKIIKYNDAEGRKRLKDYNIEEFSTVTRGEAPYHLQPFDNISSVQDQIVTNAAHSRPKPYFSGTENMLSGHFDAKSSATTNPGARPRMFSPFDDEPPLSGKPAVDNVPDAQNKFADMDFARATGHENTEFHELPLGEELSGGDVKVPKSQQERLSENIALNEVEAERDRIKAELEAKENELNALKTEFGQAEAELPGKLEAARLQGVSEGKQAQAAEAERRYAAEKQDYLQMVRTSWNDVLAEIKKLNDATNTLDEQIPEIVIGYLRELIGTERKLNDEFIANVIKSAIGRLTDTQSLIFMINPEDADIVTEKFPQYGISIDPAVPKGSVRIQTKTGDVNLSVDSWIDSLEKQINEKLRSS